MAREPRSLWVAPQKGEIYKDPLEGLKIAPGFKPNLKELSKMSPEMERRIAAFRTPITREVLDRMSD